MRGSLVPSPFGFDDGSLCLDFGIAVGLSLAGTGRHITEDARRGVVVKKLKEGRRLLTTVQTIYKMAGLVSGVPWDP